MEIIEEQSYGVIPVLRGAEDKFLILQQTDGHWSFPKGHMEKGETPRESALRELEEETAIADIVFADASPFFEEYEFERNGSRYHKINELFLGFAKNDNVLIQDSEIKQYKWATYQEALETFTHGALKRVLESVRDYLIDYDNRK